MPFALLTRLQTTPLLPTMNAYAAKINQVQVWISGDNLSHSSDLTIGHNARHDLILIAEHNCNLKVHWQTPSGLNRTS